MSKPLILFILLITLLVSCNSSAQQKSYLEKKATFQTKLLKKGSAPQEYSPLQSTQNIDVVEYKSGGFTLKGLLEKSNIDNTKRKPAIMYLHGGFALDASDIEACQSFTDAGYIVFAPSYRGENGNKGNFELFTGEVDDAKAAIQWLAHQAFVDSTKIYVFGHSIGGGISAMLSLQEDVPMKFSASSGGLYTPKFYGWEEILPYDASNPEEGKMRVLIEHIPYMNYQHYAYLGKQDEGFAINLDYYKQISEQSKLIVWEVDGDHLSSLENAIQNFIKTIEAEK